MEDALPQLLVCDSGHILPMVYLSKEDRIEQWFDIQEENLKFIL